MTIVSLLLLSQIAYCQPYSRTYEPSEVRVSPGNNFSIRLSISNIITRGTIWYEKELDPRGIGCGPTDGYGIDPSITAVTFTIQCTAYDSGEYSIKFNGYLAQQFLGSDKRIVDTFQIPAVVQPTTTPSTPSASLSASLVGNNVKLQWNVNPDQEGLSFMIYRTSNNAIDRTDDLMASTRGYTYVDDNVSPSRTYRYVLDILDDANNVIGRSNIWLVFMQNFGSKCAYLIAGPFLSLFGGHAQILQVFFQRCQIPPSTMARPLSIISIKNILSIFY